MSKKTQIPYGAYTPLIVNPRDKLTTSAVHATNFLTRMMSAFKWTGLPDTIPQRFLERYLLTDGQCFITEVNGSLYALNGVLAGEPDPYYLPRDYVVANVGLNISATYNRENDGVLVRNDDLMVGIMPLISRYSTALAENELTLYLADINMRVAFVMSTGDDDAKKSAEEFIKQIELGNFAVIGDAAVLESIKVQPGGNISQGYITQLIEYEQFLKASCYNDLGVDLNFNMKRESITAGEASQNEPGLLTLVDNMLACREEAAERLNEKYGLNISVEKASAWAIEQEEADLSVNQKPEEGEVNDDESE